MGVLEILGIARIFRPTLVGALVAGAFLLAPGFSARLIQREVAAEAQRITPLVERVVTSAFKPQRGHHKVRSARR
jgi:hypothetical protein